MHYQLVCTVACAQPLKIWCCAQIQPHPLSNHLRPLCLPPTPAMSFGSAYHRRDTVPSVAPLTMHLHNASHLRVFRACIIKFASGQVRVRTRANYSAIVLLSNAIRRWTFHHVLRPHSINRDTCITKRGMWHAMMLRTTKGAGSLQNRCQRQT